MNLFAKPGQTVIVAYDIADVITAFFTVVESVTPSWDGLPTLEVYAAGANVTSSFPGAVASSLRSDDAGNANARVTLTIPIPSNWPLTNDLQIKLHGSVQGAAACFDAEVINLSIYSTLSSGIYGNAALKTAIEQVAAAVIARLPTGNGF